MSDSTPPPGLLVPSVTSPPRTTAPTPPPPDPDPRHGRGRLLGLGLFTLLLAGALAFGAWRHFIRYRQVMETAENRRNFVPKVRVGQVRASGGMIRVILPATTSAFEEAGIFSRASGYVEKRYVDIGSRVKTGQLLAEITAPELDRQIAQAEATLGQTEAALRQTQANMELARVTYERDAKLVAQGYLSVQQGDVDRLNYQALLGSVGASQANVAAQREQVWVLRQQKAYQRVVAPFDGVVTRRNIDTGSLVQADAVSATAMFTLARDNVIRIQLHVPQDAAFGLAPGVPAVVRVPELPARTFPGTVTRLAEALQPDTRTLLAEIDVQNPDGALSPGIYCTVELRIPRKSPSLIVPGQAVIFDRKGLHVAVVEDGVAHIRDITEIRDLGTEVEVSAGVADGDKVILTPPVDLRDGDRVEIRPDAPPR
uniref:RND family efflux transporter, MFP subunit n=1 Tax=Desulfovibrio sp. U5L TaxID=596152 RepID=I2Q1A6_9BACT